MQTVIPAQQLTRRRNQNELGVMVDHPALMSLNQWLVQTAQPACFSNNSFFFALSFCFLLAKTVCYRLSSLEWFVFAPES